MIGSLHDISCKGPSDCTCSSIRIAKPTPKAKERKPLKSRPHVIPSSVREEVLDRANRICEWCEVPGGKLIIHHKLLRSQGGRDRVEDCAALHQTCHQTVHANPIAARLAGLIIGAGSNG